MIGRVVGRERKQGKKELQQMQRNPMDSHGAKIQRKNARKLQMYSDKQAQIHANRNRPAQEDPLGGAQ